MQLASLGHLQVIVGVPVGVVDDDRVRGCEIQTEAAGPCGQQHDEALKLRSVEPFHGRSSHVRARVPI